jgi:hypothetical protein
MTIRKTFVFPIALMLSCINAMAGEPGVTFLFTNGQKASFTFASKPEIMVDRDGLTVSSSNTDSTSYTFADVQRFYFEDDIETGVQNVSSEKSTHPVFSCNNGTITVCGLKAAESVSVFSINGSRIGEAKADDNGCARVDISGAANSVYVISTSNGVSFKLLKK